MGSRIGPTSHYMTHRYYTYPSDCPSVGARLMSARIRAGLSRHDLACALGVHRASIWAWEIGRLQTIERDLFDQWLSACG